MIQVLHYETQAGRRVVEEFLNGLPVGTRTEFAMLIRRPEAGERLSMPHSRSLNDIAHGLYELRVKDVAGEVRLLYYTKISGKIYLVHGVRKKDRVLPRKELNLVLKRIGELLIR